MTAGNALSMSIRAAVSCGWIVAFHPDKTRPTLHSWTCAMARAGVSVSCYFGGDDAAALNADWIREVIRANA